ncbi:MAG: TetR family transcriptional regulator [Myxococcota bacterium]
MVVKQRARKDEDKAERRRSILETAVGLLQAQGFHEITMAEVARRAGLAKGTLYLYFKSKEELFLAALEMELDDWFSDVAALLSPGPLEVPALATGLAKSLSEHPRLLELMALLHNVLEQNIEVDTARHFKRRLLGNMQVASALVEAALPDLPRGSGPTLLLRMYALVVGFRQMAEPAENVAEALSTDDLAPLRVDFEPAFAGAIIDLIRGMMG